MAMSLMVVTEVLVVFVLKWMSDHDSEQVVVVVVACECGVCWVVVCPVVVAFE